MKLWVLSSEYSVKIAKNVGTDIPTRNKKCTTPYYIDSGESQAGGVKVQALLLLYVHHEPVKPTRLRQEPPYL